jgi:hypothetical protein
LLSKKLLKHRIKRIRLRKQLRLVNNRTDVEAVRALEELETSERAEDSALTLLESLDSINATVLSHPYFTTKIEFAY